MTTRFARIALVTAAAASCVCARGHGLLEAPPPRSVFAANYDDDAMWLCRPDFPTDACRTDLEVTEIRRDGSTAVVPFVPASTPAADCFYVYPTVDSSLMPGNHIDFTDTTTMREVARSQAARFGAECRVFVPLYRQVTIGTYLATVEERSERLRAAFDDILDAFRWYRAHMDEGLPIVLLGHSQGAEMVVRLLRTMFDHDAALRARLLVAMAIGTDVEVADGSTVGGRLEHIPLCTADDELGCVVAFNSFRPEGSPYPWLGRPPPGRQVACVNPAAIGGTGKHLLSGAIFPTRARARPNLPRGTKTPFVELRDFYEAECVDGGAGFHYLAVQPAPGPGDVRTSAVDFDSPKWRTPLGLHVLDYQFTQGDLLNVVKGKLDAFTKKGEVP